MPAIKDDEWHLKMMRRELDRYLRGKVTLPALVRAVDRRRSQLTDARPALIEQIHEEWRILEELNELATKGGLQVPMPRHQRLLEELLRALDRLINLALSEIRT